MAWLKLERLGWRERAGLSLAVACIVVFAADRLVVQPVLQRLRDLEDEIRREELGLAYNVRVLASEQRVAGQYDNVRDLLGSAPSTAQAIDEMKGQIDGLLSDAGVTLRAMEDRRTEGLTVCDEYSVDVKFEAATKSLIRFLYELPRLPGTLRVSKLQIAAGREPGMVEGSMLISKLVIPPGQP